MSPSRLRRPGSRWGLAGWALALSLLLWLPVVAAGRPLAELRRLPAAISALAMVGPRLVAAGTLPDGRPWLAAFDPELQPLWERRIDSCGRCGLLAAVAVDARRVALAGYVDFERSGREDGFLLLVDAESGESLASRRVLAAAGGRFLALEVAADRMVAAGEAVTHGGAGVDPWLVWFDARTLEPLREWQRREPLPAGAAVLAAGSDSIAVAGWTLAHGGPWPAGWFARLDPLDSTAPPREKDAQRPLPFDVTALLALGNGTWLLAGQAGVPTASGERLAPQLRLARLDEGARFALSAADGGEAIGLVTSPHGPLLVAATRQPTVQLPAVVVLAVEPVGLGVTALLSWRDGNRPIQPRVVARTAVGDGLFVGGSYPETGGGSGERGWLVRLPLTPEPRNG
ncbi:hypothetical protein HRbin40_00474 [bacterium HR40]|nr:hypothetical protein HRbin40_00474 [bacterium HR40]